MRFFFGAVRFENVSFVEKFYSLDLFRKNMLCAFYAHKNKNFEKKYNEKHCVAGHLPVHTFA